MVDEKKHLVRMSTARGDIVVHTDDLSEVLDVMLQQQSSSRKATYTEEDVVQRAQQMVNSWIAQQQVQYQQQPMAQQQAPEQRSRTQGVQAQQAGVGAQGVQRSYLDITPDKMTAEVWASLSKEQQKEYAKRYMG